MNIMVSVYNSLHILKLWFGSKYFTYLEASDLIFMWVTCVCAVTQKVISRGSPVRGKT